MIKEELINDIILQVYVDFKSKELVYSVLNEYIPKYDTIELDVVGKLEDNEYVFKSEDELLSYYLENTGIRQTLYWNKRQDNVQNIMVGVNITNDDKIVFSLTFDGTLEDEAKLFEKFKTHLNSRIGIISYVNPVYYANGRDFIELVKKIG